MDKSKILDALNSLGFSPEEIDENGYFFDYEGVRIFYEYDEDDSDFFRFTAPRFYEIKEVETRMLILDAINTVNCGIKYSKTILQDDCVGISFETRTVDGMNAEDLVQFAILVVHATVTLFLQIVTEVKVPLGENTDQNLTTKE